MVRFYLFIFLFVYILGYCLHEDVLRTVKDGSYGTQNPTEKGGWNGIVGEIVRKVCIEIEIQRGVLIRCLKL